MIVIRYADDTIVGFEHEHEARALLFEVLSVALPRHAVDARRGVPFKAGSNSIKHAAASCASASRPRCPKADARQR